MAKIFACACSNDTPRSSKLVGSSLSESSKSRYLAADLRVCDQAGNWAKHLSTKDSLLTCLFRWARCIARSWRSSSNCTFRCSMWNFLFVSRIDKLVSTGAEMPSWATNSSRRWVSKVFEHGRNPVGRLPSWIIAMFSFSFSLLTFVFCNPRILLDKSKLCFRMSLSPAEGKYRPDPLSMRASSGWIGTWAAADLGLRSSNRKMRQMTSQTK